MCCRGDVVRERIGVYSGAADCTENAIDTVNALLIQVVLSRL